MKRMFFLVTFFFMVHLGFAQYFSPMVNFVNFIAKDTYQNKVILDFTNTSNKLPFEFSLSRGLDPRTNQYESVNIRVEIVYSTPWGQSIIASQDITSSSFNGTGFYENKHIEGNLSLGNRSEILSYGKISIRWIDKNNVSYVKYSTREYTFIDRLDVPQLLDKYMPYAWGKLSSGKGIVDHLNDVPSSFRHYSNSSEPLLSSVGKNSISSSSDSYGLVLQSDGNLVIYKNGTNTVMWASNVYVKNPSANDRFKLFFQNDGNLVIYKQDSAGQYSIVFWATNNTFVPNNDGNLSNVKYGFWVMQNDGNFVLYYPSTKFYGAYNIIAATNSNNSPSKNFGKIL
ncbi:hypothetical protein [Sphingobacterium sp. BIGb0165]|uniref:hypothetical protein n=1 Tax=Sphingobacterium sp. BIGb0165 TaxID=2940615 RepID=UPI002167B48E|nr:hypothetical protein [Sphingobacterium sp. BIGb0165]MCS4225198.1 hypothetical protein [Sphingobacterium sp. BIGb0165]